ncbi:MAG TPA: hypothetical protein VFV81_03690, partial [Verrucomicrobiae bacterium]|nr:hypothetical protein [Verrucomicrobiae bacterium]
MEIYEQLRDEAVAGFRRNEARIDSRLSAKETDSRRGLTLLWRPPLSVRAEIGHYLEQLTRAFPDQYFYHPDEFHV